MQSFLSSFLGIPLPAMYQNQFEKTLLKLHAIEPSIKTVYPKTPHITIYYLAKRIENNLKKLQKR